jgi:hypothetical protein
MNSPSQIETIDQQRHSLDRAASVQNLVTALRATESALRESIRAEEQRSSLGDPNDPCYSMLALSMRKRADNLLTTIATLEAARPAA